MIVCLSFVTGCKIKINLPMMARWSTCYKASMHEVTPKLVAMAVSTVMMMFRILLQSCFLSFSISFACFDGLSFYSLVILNAVKDLGCIRRMLTDASLCSG